MNFFRRIYERIYDWWYKIKIDYDDNGNVIHGITNGFEIWQEYNENNQMTHYKDSKGLEMWWDYKNGQLVHYKDNTGEEYWLYHEDGKVYEIRNRNS